MIQCPYSISFTFGCTQSKHRFGCPCEDSWSDCVYSMRLEINLIFSLYFLSVDVAPSLISELRAEKIDQKSITLVWRKPSYPNSSRTEYEVKYYEKVNALLYPFNLLHWWFYVILFLCASRVRNIGALPGKNTNVQVGFITSPIQMRFLKCY